MTAAIGIVNDGDITSKAVRAAAVAVAKSCTGHASEIVIRHGHQLHGAIGTTLEHSLHRYTNALLNWRNDFGSHLGAVVLTGAGSAFSAGGDIKAIASGDRLFGQPTARQRTGYQIGIQRLTRAMVACDVPIVAAANGAAIGAGCDLALMCDIRIASDKASFAESFVRLGLIPGDGGAWLLPRIIGHARASVLALTGRRIAAATAQQWGLVFEVVATEDLMASATALAKEIADQPRDAVRMTKALLRRAPDIGLDATLELSAAMQPLCHTTDEHHSAVAAILATTSK